METKKNVTLYDAKYVVKVLKNLGFVKPKFLIGGSIALKEYGLLDRPAGDVDIIVKFSEVPSFKLLEKLQDRIQGIKALAADTCIGYGDMNGSIYLKLNILNGLGQTISTCIWFLISPELYTEYKLGIDLGNNIYLNTLDIVLKKKYEIMENYRNSGNFDKFSKHLKDLIEIKNKIAF